mgnify:CR=1 FL=1
MLSSEPVSLVEVMLECRAMIEPQAQKRGISMTFPRLETPYYVKADRTRVKQVLINLGSAYILAGRHRLAVPLLERASELDPDNPAVWSNLAAAYLGQIILSTRAKQDKALAAYRRVIELDASYPHAHYNMGLIHIDRRDWDAAYIAFTLAIESNPHDEDAHVLRQRVEQLRARPDASPLAN